MNLSTVNSTTFPQPAIAEKGYYRIINWDNKKPCVELISEWEDIMYRARSYNAYR